MIYPSIEYYAAIKKNEEDHYVLTSKDVLKMLSEKDFGKPWV